MNSRQADAGGMGAASVGAAKGSGVKIFIIFDVEHDAELYARIGSQSREPGSAFAVSGGSERFTATDVWSERARRRIRAADHVIVICGEHTAAAMGVFSELRITREEQKHYILVWGRREIECTKPAGAKTSEGMYSWTEPILRDQITQMERRDRPNQPTDREKRQAKPEPPNASVSNT